MPSASDNSSKSCWSQTGVLGGGILALAPFLIWHAEFRQLFWFGDDLFLIDLMSLSGLRTWSLQLFSENFVPLFKFLWGGSILLFGGSYAAMLWLMWLTHAVNTFFFGRLLLRAGFPLLAVLVAQLLFGLSPTNLESLGWSVQWSSLLATGFLLQALWWHEAHREPPKLFSARLLLPLFFLVAASALSFSRGVLTGAVISLGLMLPALWSWRAREFVRSIPGALICLLPAVATGLVILKFAYGNQNDMAGHWGEAAAFSASYFLFNPGHLIFGDTSLQLSALVGIGAIKIGVIIAALMIARGRVFHVLLLFLAFDLGSAILVGVGRFHTGYLLALISRYQYSSLIASLPFLALLLSTLVERLPSIHQRRWVAIAGLVFIVGWSLARWPVRLKSFTTERGTEMRALINAPATNDPSVLVPALGKLHIERAKALARAYDLH